MRNKFLIVSLYFMLVNLGIYGQEIEVSADKNSNQYSNDKIPTSIEEIISTNLTKKITGNEKTKKDLLVVLKSDGQLTTYNLKNLEQAWNLQFTDSSYNKMRNRFTIENSILYATSTQKELTAVNINDGSQYWKTEIGLHKNISKRYVINGQQLPIKGSLIYLASNNKQLYAFTKPPCTQSAGVY